MTKATTGPETDSFLTLLHAALRETFGAPFHVWSGGVGAACLLPGPDDDDDAAYTAHGGLFRSARFSQWLDESLAARAPRIVVADDVRLLLVPVPRTEAGAVVAVGEFPPADLAPGGDEWLLRLARLFVVEFEHGRQRGTVQQELLAYARQVTDDFEELSFLRSLAECLEIGDTFASRWQTAQSVLPFLRLAVKAEAVVLVAAERHHDGKEHADPQVGAVVYWAGQHVIDDARVLRLVHEFRDAAVEQPVVRNRLDQPGAAPSIPGLREFVLAPVSRHGDLYGWVAALNRLGPSAVARQGEIPWWGLSDLEFGSTEAGLLVSASAIFAACARNVDLIRQKENLLVGVVRALVSAIEARDRYTFGHSERVALTSQRLGEQLGLSRQHCRRLYLTGLLHDIGKIGVSDQVLRKPGQLTRSEQEQVKQHTQLGYAILHDLDQLAFVLPGVLHHHERFDGKGYPNGFVGEQIPLDARIIAVADAYDAMISNRPYREGMSDSQAELCLRAGAAVQWDASVVEALFEAHDDIRAIIRGYQPPAPLVNGQLWVDGQRCADNQQWADGQLCASTAARTCLASLDLSDVVLSTLPPP